MNSKQNNEPVKEPAAQDRAFKFINLLLVLYAIFMCFIGVACIQLFYHVYENAKDLMEKNIAVPGITTMPTLNAVKEGYTLAISYFMMAGGILLLVVLIPKLSTFAISLTSISGTLKQLAGKVETLHERSIVHEERLKNLK